MEKQETTTQIPNSNEHCDNLSCDKRRKGLDKISKGKNTHERNRQKGMVSAFVQGKGQNAALKWLMESKTPVCIYLISGVKFEGEISSFDAFTICVNDVKKHQQIIYKDKISTINVAFGTQKQDNAPFSYDQHKKKSNSATNHA